MNRTFLYGSHKILGAKFVNFSGWEMPIHYGSQINEHNCVRNDLGIFDVSRMNIFDFEGTAEGYYSDIEKFLETLSDPEVAKDTGFIDHSRSVMWLYNLYE